MSYIFKFSITTRSQRLVFKSKWKKKLCWLLRLFIFYMHSWDWQNTTDVTGGLVRLGSSDHKSRVWKLPCSFVKEKKKKFRNYPRNVKGRKCKICKKLLLVALLNFTKLSRTCSVVNKNKIESVSSIKSKVWASKRWTKKKICQ